MPSADATSAIHCVHAGSACGASVAMSTSLFASRSPSATPTTSSSSTITADIRRAVPAIRWRVASSVIATVSDMPGSSTISAASVTSDGLIATIGDTRYAVAATNAEPTSSNTRAWSLDRAAICASRPRITPLAAATPTSASPPPKNTAIEPAVRPCITVDTARPY